MSEECKICKIAGKGHYCHGDDDVSEFTETPGYTNEYCKTYQAMTTDELLEMLPSNLQLARNENAPQHDRWRVYNVVTEKHVAPGAASCRELLIDMLAKIDKQMVVWTGRV